MLAEIFSNSVTNLFYFLISVAFLFGLLCQGTKQFPSFREYVPALMTSLGILGTFIGIVMGLYNFDPENIDLSIQTLLGGLKTAFNTSIAGMIATISFKCIVSFSNKEEEVKAPEAGDDLAPEILSAIREQGAQMDKLVQAIGSDGDNSLLSQIKMLRTDLNDCDKRRNEAFAQFRAELSQQLGAFLQKVSSSASDQIVEALRQVIQDFNAKFTEQFGENFKNLNDAVGKMVEWQKEYREHLILLEKQYKEAVQTLEQCKTAMKTISEKSEAIPEAMKKLEELLAAQKAQIEAMDANLSAVAEARQKAVDAVPEIRKCITGMTDELKASVAGVAGELETTVRQFNDHAKASNDALVETSRQIVEKSTSIGQSMNDFSVSLTESNKSFAAQAGQSIEDLIARIDAVKTALGQTTEAATGSIRDVSDQFKTAAEGIVADTAASAQRTMEGSRQQIEQTVEALAKNTHDQINSQMDHFDKAMTQELNAALSDLGSALATIANTIADRFEESSKRVSG